MEIVVFCYPGVLHKIFGALSCSGLRRCLSYSQRAPEDFWPDAQHVDMKRTRCSLRAKGTGRMVFGTQCTYWRCLLAPQLVDSAELPPPTHTHTHNVTVEVRDAANSHYVDFKLSSAVVLHTQARQGQNLTHPRGQFWVRAFRSVHVVFSTSRHNA